MLTIHASRSRYETFMKCMRLGFLQYHWGGLGVVKSGKNLFLTTGIVLHFGLELIGKWCKANPKAKELRGDVLEGIVQRCKDKYMADVFPDGWKTNGGGFDLSYETLDEQGNLREITEYEMDLRQQYTLNEQCALVEALIRVFAIRTLPTWLRTYRVVSVELDMAFPIVESEEFSVVQSAKVDWVLQELDSKDLYLVSFKGYRTYGPNEAKAAGHDTQGLSESWAFDEYLKTKRIDKRIMGVKMLYLVKGARKESKSGSGNWNQNSPLIRGYRRLTEDGPEYAHSWFIPKPENDSGWGALGRSWDKIEVFSEGEELGDIKGWISLLDSGEVQPECGDILAEQVVEPEPYMRHPNEIESWYRQTKERERDIASRLVNGEKMGGGNELEYLDDYFPQNRAACHYYPGSHNDCPYVPMCFGTEEERSHPLANGYVPRTPHHKAELVQIGKG